MIHSFSRINVHLPFSSLFAKSKKIHLVIYDAKLTLKEDLINELKAAAPKKSSFEIDKVTVYNGEILFQYKDYQVSLKELNLNSITQEQDTLFKIKSTAFKIDFPFSGDILSLQGSLESEIKKQSSEWQVRKFIWNTDKMTANVNGKFEDSSNFVLNAIIQGDPYYFLYPELGELSPQGQTFGNAKITSTKDGHISIDSQFKAAAIQINNEEFKDLSGSVKWENQTREIRVNAAVNDGIYSSNARIQITPQKALLEFKNFQTIRLAKVIEIEESIPLGGQLIHAQLDISHGLIKGKLKVGMDQQFKSSLFQGKGEIQLEFNTRNGNSMFHANQFVTRFGSINLSGKTVRDTKRVELQCDALITDAEFLNPYSLYYLDIDLAPWNLSKGQGSLHLDFTLHNKEVVYSSQIKLNDLMIQKQPISTITGSLAGTSKNARGNFQFHDASLNGAGMIDIREDGFKIDFLNVCGQSKKVVTILGFDLDLTGIFNGDFFYQKKKKQLLPDVWGNYSAGTVSFYGYNFQNVKGGLKSNSNDIHLQDISFDYQSGKGLADVYLDYSKQYYDLSGEINHMDIQRFHPEFSGQASTHFQGKGKFNQDAIRASITAENVSFYQGISHAIEGDAQIMTDFNDFSIRVNANLLHGSTSSPFELELSNRGDEYFGRYQFNLSDMNVLIPWGNNEGSVKVDGQIKTQHHTIKTMGMAHISGKTMSFPNFPHTLDDFSGRLSFDNYVFKLNYLQGKIGNGDVSANGRMKVENNQLKDLSINIEGKNMNLYPLDRVTCLVSSKDLNVRLVERKLLLSGELLFHSALWEREIEEDITFNTQAALSVQPSRIMEMMEFDLKLIGKNKIKIQNSLVQANGVFDLQLTGNPDFPILTGVIESKKGEVLFSEKPFQLLKGKLIFTRKKVNDPLIQVDAEAYIKNYRIRFNISGSQSQMKPEFSSSPPLPSAQVFSLISQGELFKRFTSDQMKNQIGAGTTGLAFTQLTEDLKILRKAKKILGLDFLRLDPNLSAKTFKQSTSRLIVGKSISKDLLIVYSTNFQDIQEDIYYLQYQISPDIVLIGMRNEDGRISFDLRYRKRQ
jgi:hypothetical protein